LRVRTSLMSSFESSWCQEEAKGPEIARGKVRGFPEGVRLRSDGAGRREELEPTNGGGTPPAEVWLGGAEPPAEVRGGERGGG
jgi:hypothetical protein